MTDECTPEGAVHYLRAIFDKHAEQFDKKEQEIADLKKKLENSESIFLTEKEINSGLAEKVRLLGEEMLEKQEVIKTADFISEWYAKEEGIKGSHLNQIKEQARSKGLQDDGYFFKLFVLKSIYSNVQNLVQTLKKTHMERQTRGESVAALLKYIGIADKAIISIILKADKEKEILTINKKAAEITGYSNEDIQQKSVSGQDCYIDELLSDSSQFIKLLEDAAAEKEGKKLEEVVVDIKRKDGLYAHAKLCVIKEKHGIYSVILSRKKICSSKPFVQEGFYVVNMPSYFNDKDFNEFKAKFEASRAYKIRQGLTEINKGLENLGNATKTAAAAKTEQKPEPKERFVFDMAKAKDVDDKYLDLIRILAKEGSIIINSYAHDNVYTKLAKDPVIKQMLYLEERYLNK
jgi:PAS domain S-box-containing protein